MFADLRCQPTPHRLAHSCLLWYSKSNRCLEESSPSPSLACTSASQPSHSLTRFPSWRTEEVPAQQYLEIDEVKTDSFRVTWHPLSAEEGQHKLMWIPVYGGKTEEVGAPKRPPRLTPCSLLAGRVSLLAHRSCVFQVDGELRK